MSDPSDFSSVSRNGLIERILHLEQEVESLNLQLRNQNIHAEDDLHKVRSLVIKNLGPEIARLDDLLSANARTPPKTHIVDSYGKDTLYVVSDLVKEMRKANKSEPVQTDDDDLKDGLYDTPNDDWV